MRFTKVVFIGVILMLALGSFGMALAQETVEPVDLVIWTNEGETEAGFAAIEELFAEWAEEFSPDSTLSLVNVDTEEMRNNILTAGLAGSGLPDALIGPNDPIGVYVAAGLLQPVGDLIDASVFTPATLELASFEDEVYGLPTSFGNHLMLMMNTDYVSEAPETWEELIATAEQVEAENPDVQGFAYNLNEPFWFVPFVFGFGGQVWDEEGNFALDSQAWIDAYQFVHDLKFDAEVVPTECDYDCANSLFAAGDAAMIINGDWAIGAYRDPEQSPGLAGDKLAVAPWPALPNGERPQPYFAGRYLSIPVTTEGAKLDALQSWLTWMTTDPEAISAYTSDVGVLPAIASAIELPAIQEDPLLSGSLSAAQTGVGMPGDPLLRCMWDGVRPQLEGVMADSVTPADAAAAAQVSAEACAADFE